MREIVAGMKWLLELSSLLTHLEPAMTHKPVIAQEWTCDACNKTELTAVIALPEGWTSGTRV
jgi:hypothetical protein